MRSAGITISILQSRKWTHPSKRGSPGDALNDSEQLLDFSRPWFLAPDTGVRAPTSSLAVGIMGGKSWELPAQAWQGEQVLT